jgi:hypothetical protein
MIFDSCISKWHEEDIQYHKFDEINVEDYDNPSWILHVKYLGIYIAIFIGIVRYVTDLFSVIFLFTNGGGLLVNPQLYLQGGTFEKFQPILPYIYLGCLIISLILFLADLKQAQIIVESSDISSAFTNTFAYRFYSIKWYCYYCLFDAIKECQEVIDGVALYTYFYLRSWKRLLFVESPRNAINLATLFYIFKTKGYSLDPDAYVTDNLFFNLALILMAFVTFLFLVNCGQTLLAFMIYIPLLCHIQGNLKEFVLHNIDKRITVMIQMFNRRKKPFISKDMKPSAIEGMCYDGKRLIR